MIETPSKRWARILIITAIEPELDAVLKAFGLDRLAGKPEKDEKDENREFYWRCHLDICEGVGNSKDCFYDVIIKCLFEAGNVNAGIKTFQFIRDWKPKVVLMVGIAGGANGAKRGDIVIGKCIHYYASGKMTPEGREERPKPSAAAQVLLNFVNVIPTPDWGLLLKETTKPDESVQNPEIYKDAFIAVGELVVADKKLCEQIATWNGTIKAIAMEDYGIYEAARASKPSVQCLSIRGISDLAGEDKTPEMDKKWQPYAATVAASYAKYYLLKGPITCNDEIKPLQQRLSEKLQNYYEQQWEEKYDEIVNSIREGNTLVFVGPGVNLYDKFTQSNEQQDKKLPTEIDITDYLCKHIKDDNLIGFPCTICHSESLPKGCPIWALCGENPDEESLDFCPLWWTRKLNIAKNKNQYLSQYGFSGGKSEIRQNLGAKFQDRNLKHNDLHHFLSQYFIGQDRRDKTLPDLIVTTNYDCALESALGKQEFYVLSYAASGENCGRFEYKKYPDDSNKCPQLIENPNNNESLSNLTKFPVILKLFGSFLEGSIALLKEDYINYLIPGIDRECPLSQLLPPCCIRSFREKDLLFIGYTPSDEDLHLILHRFCKGRERAKNYRNSNTKKGWFIHQSIPGEFECSFWNNDWNIDLLECPLEFFIDILRRKLELKKATN
jgi:nucleoside phosphorylase